MSNKIVLQIDPSSTVARNSEATFVTLKSGRILLIWSKFLGKDHSDFGASVIACKHSDDAGRTWSTQDRLLVRRDRAATNVMSPSALRLQDGRIALLYLRKVGFHVCEPWICFSDDEAKTFSKPVKVSVQPGDYGVNNDRLIQTRSGRLIMPVGLCRWGNPHEIVTRPVRLPGDTATHYPTGMEPVLNQPTLIFFYFSDDGGKTWPESLTSFYHCLPDGSGLQEPGIVELPDGRLWCYTRTGYINVHAKERDYRQWESFSKDGGHVWSPPKPSGFISPCSPMQVKPIPSTGQLLAIWNDHSGRFKVPRPKPISWMRTPLVSAISKNGGRTWAHHKLLEKSPDQGFCYPAIHFVEDHVLLSYNAGGAQSRDCLDTQRVRRISLGEMYA